MTYKKKLIEVALPLEAINREAAREKSIRHGHPSTLHLWWARRPLAACRAVLFASLVDDPSEYVAELLKDSAKRKAAEKELKARKKLWDEMTAVLEKAKAGGISAPAPGPEPKLEDIIAEIERERLFEIIRQLVKWENSNNERVLNAARAEIMRSCNGSPPPVYDPFCGGGSIPLEAQRLGLEAHASDLNPVPVLINKALIEIPPKFAGKPPVHPGSAGILAGGLPGREHSSGLKGKAAIEAEVPGWRSRGYLPHFDQPGLVQSITFRLHDSLPERLIQQWKQELRIKEDLADRDDGASGDAELRQRIAKYEDAGHGDCWLRDPAIARLVENALLHFDGERYRLIAWCVMPNHVHAIIEGFESWPLTGVIHSWKSFTASAANKILNRSGEFWFREYHDRFIRDENHFRQAIAYVEENPVKAGLVKTARDWKFSSAAKQSNHSPAKMPALPGTWKGAAGLAEDIRYYGQWMRDEAEKRIGHLYPKVKLPKEHGGGEATVIAWLWARTVASPNPAAKGAHVPLVRSFWLSTKAGKKAWVEPIVDQSAMTYRFEVRSGNGEPRSGTVGRTGGTCVLTGSPMPLDYIRSEGRAGRHGVKLMTIVAEGGRGRIYLSPVQSHAEVAESAKPQSVPETDLPRNPRDFKTPNYGMTKHRQLFTNRQLVLLTTFCDLVSATRMKVLEDSGGNESLATAVTTYLALAVSKLADAQTSLCRWKASMDQTIATFGRQAIPMVWDFAESNAFAKMAGDFGTTLKNMMRVLVELPAWGSSLVRQISAESLLNDRVRVFSTDPPYYDNVGYADLSDFFYVWLRSCLQQVYPELLGTVLVPKAEELIADPFRQGGKDEARLFFEQGMARVLVRMRDASDPHFPTTIYYAFKQAESESDADEEVDDESTSRASTGWETFLQALADAGWQIDGTWPM